jgi:hypothetical protein
MSFNILAIFVFIKSYITLAKTKSKAVHIARYEKT